MLFGYSLSVVTNVNKIQHGSAHYRAAYYGMSVYRSVEILRYVRLVVVRRYLR